MPNYKYKYLHIVPVEYAYSFMPMLDVLASKLDNFDDHYILITSTFTDVLALKPLMLSFRNIIYLESSKYIPDFAAFTVQISSLMKASEHIFLYGLYPQRLSVPLILDHNKEICKRCVWLFASDDGSDECFRAGISSRKMTLRLCKLKRIERKIPYICASSEIEMQILKKRYGELHKYYVISQPGKYDFSPEPMQDLTSPARASDGLVISLTAKTASYSKAIECFPNMPDSNPNVLFSVYYGPFLDITAWHCKDREAKAARVFVRKQKSVKGCVVSKNVSEKVFSRYLQLCDAAVAYDIFYSLPYFMLAGKKCYLPEESFAYRYFTERNIPVFKLEDLQCASVDDIRAPFDQEPGRRWGAEQLSSDTVLRAWQNLLIEISARN